MMLYTIGHSNHSPGKFFELLHRYEIVTLVDVRFWPSSRRLPHFNRAELEQSLAASGMRYLWFGKELGGKSDGNTARSVFQNRIHELAALAKSGTVVIMCAEEDYSRCHRKHLLSKPLIAAGLEIMHIRGDGRLSDDQGAQLSLFDLT